MDDGKTTPNTVRIPEQKQHKSMTLLYLFLAGKMSLLVYLKNKF